MDPETLQERLARLAATSPADPKPEIEDRCPKCDNTRWCLDAMGRAHRCDCAGVLSRSMPARLAVCGVGTFGYAFTIESFEARFLDDPMTRRYVAWAKLWLEMAATDRPDLVLLGPNGTGKTGLAVAILRGALAQGEYGYFTELDALSIRWRATFGRTDDDAETESKLFAFVSETSTLVLDELTGTRHSEFIEDKLRTIIVARQRAQRPTVITMNVPATCAGKPDEIQDHLARSLGPALYDKLRERAQFYPMFGPSKRQPWKRARP